ncbi:hypothetical protein NFI96_032778, partial [Prochilodus magdalenae]
MPGVTGLQVVRIAGGLTVLDHQFTYWTPVLERSTDTLKFHIPSGNTGKVKVCVVTADGRCHSNIIITYGSQPTCTGLQPRSTWASGGRRIQVLGSSLEYVEKVTVDDKEMSVTSLTVGVWFNTPPLGVGAGSGLFRVSLRVGNSTVDCVDKLSYLPNPEFTSFSKSQEYSEVSVVINKKQDRLNVREEDVKVWGLQEEKQFECAVQNVISTAIVCNILERQDIRINVTSLRTLVTRSVPHLKLKPRQPAPHAEQTDSLRFSSTQACRMRTVDLGMLLLFQSGIYALLEFSADGEIRNFAVGNGKVFVVTDSQLLQLQHDLVEEKHRDISNLTHQNRVTIVLPFEANKTLITCGTSDCGYCEVLDISDVTRSIHWEKVSVGPAFNKSSVSLLVDVDGGKAETEKYMLVARGKLPEHCGYEGNGVTLLNTLDSQSGGIFSRIDIHGEASISPESDAEWIDGFQTSPPSHSYLLVNVKAGPAVVVLRMKKSRSKSDMVRSLQGAELQCCADKARRKLLSSSVVVSSGSPVLWVGIFTAQEPHDPQNTALALYDLSQTKDQVPSHFSCRPPCTAQKGSQALSPLAVVFRHSSMSTVAAEKRGSWIVLYIGTGNGELMKIVLDKAFNAGCLTVLYRSDDDRKVFPKMLFDPVDHQYMYIALRNQIRRVAVTQCGMYSTLRDCRAAQDPSCGWCVNSKKCSIRDECSDSNWISIPEDSFQKELISFHVFKVSTELTLNLHLSVNGSENPLFTCTVMRENENLCNSHSVVFPNCTCNFPSQQLPANVTVTVTIEDQKITERLKLRSCPDITETSLYNRCVACVSAGCYWSSRPNSCSWAIGSAPQVPTSWHFLCYTIIHIIMILGILVPVQTAQPEIFSLEPKEISFHGKNNAVLRGKNLGLVKKIRFQGSMECSPKDRSVPTINYSPLYSLTPVLDRSGTTLRFNIPSGNKGTVRVCVVTEDGRCHVWCFAFSGGRKIRVLGNNLRFVDAVLVHPSLKQITLNSSEHMWFHTLSQRENMGAEQFSVSLKMGNSTVDCVDKLSYLPDPEFLSFSTSKVDSDMQVTIQKTADSLNMSNEEVIVRGLQEEKQFECVIDNIRSTAITCKILGRDQTEIRIDSLKVMVGNFTKQLEIQRSGGSVYIIVIFIILVLLGAVGAFGEC